MRNRWLVAMLIGVLALVASSGVWAQESSAELVKARDTGILRGQAVGLSLLFPGIGQLTSGQRNKGTALMVAEMGCLVIWLTSHEDFDTHATQFDIEAQRYLGLRQGGTYGSAEESWQRLSGKKDDLDRSHLLRRAFGLLTIAVYSYNAVDILLTDRFDSVVGNSVGVAPMLTDGTTGLLLVKQF